MAGEQDLFLASTGIAGGQSTLALMLAEANGLYRTVPLPKLTELLATHPARRFRVHSRKGELAVGADADLVIVNLHEEGPLQKETLFYRSAAHTPYLGRCLRGRVLRTMLRGKAVFREGKIVGQPIGRLVEAERAEG